MSAAPERKLYRLTVDAEGQGMRLDAFLATRIADLSRSILRRIIDLGGVHLDGRRARRCSLTVDSGQRIEVHVDGLPLVPFSLSEAEILFRDPDILVLDKPAGVDVQPTPARYKGTLYDALLRYLQDPYRRRQRPELGMVQRLDRDTSGVLVFSVAKRAHRSLTGIFAERRAEKTYLALVAGAPVGEEGEMRSLLARNRATNLMRSVERGGREAVTRYRVRERFGEASLLEVEIPTGRSHQIRVHLSEAGHPLLGDRRYGGPEVLAGMPFARQMLHSWRLRLPHPVSGREMAFEASLPPDMEAALANLR